MAKVRVGIIGTGGMAQGHIRRLAQNPEAEIAALCDIKEAALKRTVENHPTLKDVPQFYDFRDMIANVNLDAIHIDTPHTIHYEQIMYGLDKGLHVLTEKPMVCTVEHAHHVVNKVKETGSGAYGDVQFVQGLQCQHWLQGCRGAWRHHPALSGGGQLNDSGSHLLGVLLFTTGLTVESVAGFIDNF